MRFILFFSALFCLVWVTNGLTNVLTASNPSSCGQYSGVSATNVTFKYYRFNNTLDYVLVVNAQRPGINPILRIDVTVLGNNAPPQVIQLCNGVTQCPLPQSTVTIAGSQKLNGSFVTNVPTVVWTVPDIAGTAMFLMFSDPSTIVSCVRMDITNGVTSKTSAVPWTTGLIAVALAITVGVIGVVTSGSGAAHIHAFGPEKGLSAHAPTPDPSSAHPHAPGDPLLLFLHFQFISSSGFLSLNYPPIYRVFTTNFAWANFIIPIGAFRRAAIRMRKCNVNPPSSSSSSSSLPLVDAGLTKDSAKSGIPAYAAKLGIDEQDIFGLAYLIFLSVCALIIIVVLLVTLVLQIYVWKSEDGERRRVWLNRRRRWHQMSSNNTLRVLSVALSTLATLSFFQWTQKCTSGLTYFASVVALFLIIGVLVVVSFLIIKVSLQSDGLAQLYQKNGPYARRWGSLYDVLDEKRIFFVLLLVGLVLIRSAIVGFGQGSGMTQVIAMIAVEGATAVVLFVFKPYFSVGYNRVNYMIQGCKVVSFVLLLPLTGKFHLSPLVATVLGVVLLAINSLVGLVLAILMVIKLGWGILWYRKKHIALESEKVRQKVVERSTTDSSYFPSRKSMASGMSDPRSPFTPMAFHPEQGEMVTGVMPYNGLIDANNVPHLDDLEENVGERLYVEAGASPPLSPPLSPPRSPLRQQHQQELSDSQRPTSWNGYVVPDGVSLEQRPSSWHEPGMLPTPPIVFYPPPEPPEPPLAHVRSDLPAYPLSPPPPLVLHPPVPPSPPLPPLPASDENPPWDAPGYTALPGAQPTVGGQMGTDAEQSAFSGLMEEMRGQQGRIVSHGDVKGEKKG